MLRKLGVLFLAPLFLVSLILGVTSLPASAADGPVVWDPEPTVARIGPGLKPTLTVATYLRDADGTPRVGEHVVFSVLAKMPSLQETPKPAYEVCRAVSDADGLATCKGSVPALVASVVSIVTGGGYATLLMGPFPTEEFTRLPVILRG